MGMTLSVSAPLGKVLTSVTDIGCSDLGDIFIDASSSTFVIIEGPDGDYFPAYVGDDYHIDANMSVEWPLTRAPNGTTVTITNVDSE